jgi:hypothetical protein
MPTTTPIAPIPAAAIARRSSPSGIGGDHVIHRRCKLAPGHRQPDGGRRWRLGRVAHDRFGVAAAHDRVAAIERRLRAENGQRGRRRVEPCPGRPNSGVAEPRQQLAIAGILLIGADAMTTIVDQNDRSTAVLFADGAGAVVLEKRDGSSGFVDHILGADGRMAPLGRAGHPGTQNKLYQNGREVFKFAARIFPEMFEKLLARNGVSPEEVQYIIPHQANARIIYAAARKMEVPEEKIVVNLDRFGNTSAASIPLSYPDIYDELEPGRYIVTVGFGFGLTWAANLYRI